MNLEFTMNNETMEAGYNIHFFNVDFCLAGGERIFVFSITPRTLPGTFQVLNKC